MLVNLDIVGYQSISPLGSTKEEVYSSYSQDSSFISNKNGRWQGSLSKQTKKELEKFVDGQKNLKKTDRSVQLACFVAEKLKKEHKILPGCGVNAGSSRGSTSKLEESYFDFYDKKKVSTQSSPLTTAGNIASFIGQQLGSNGIAISHSITCSTFSHAVANAAAWLNAGMCEQFAVFGSEAPLTPFTFAQMDALGIYSTLEKDSSYPCLAMDTKKKSNTMILGEGAFGFILEKNNPAATYQVESIGYAKESTSSAASVSDDAGACQEAMKMAIAHCKTSDIDVIVSHCPGTIKGDIAELNAIRLVFGEKHPALCNNKWKIGHSFGASAGFSVEMGLLMLEKQELFTCKYLNEKVEKPSKIKKVLVNALGFGGNALSLVLSKKQH